MRRLQTVGFLVPGGCAGKNELDSHPQHAHKSERAGKNRSCAWCRKDEQEGTADGRQREVCNAVRDPSEDIKERMCVCREDIGKVGTVQHILERRENLDPNVGSVFGRDKSASGVRVLSACRQRNQQLGQLTGSRRSKVGIPILGGMVEKTGW